MPAVTPAFTVVEIPSRASLRHIVAAACFAAAADGRVRRAERRGLLRMLRRWGLLAQYGRAGVLGDYRARLIELLRRPLTRDDLTRFRGLAGTLTGQRAYLAAEQVVMADGHASPEEIQLLGLLREALAIGPAARLA